ncbi:hypothetical protein Rvan_2884 [Rhodomicrobium vannielii ATCC 17100]|uniref:Uncharacterized protein n=1 Tax=Rhodomicrobium vannielii (strain ATCC 17100 / DSM 162 / LMG 4299 / NCIMB 10020 / ATH 3.1.1) TaxID=648757 RepID=E3HZ43_RHOVT|nr:hypothetical protein [Rhodomicrobium vannielii]ADP72090.1 hypothetical protein Rvan_2884 [Rhodomicrobium vannielii ATCC 17100]
MDRLLVSAGLAIAAALLTAAPSSAKIKCVDESQVINGQLAVTPWCEDENLAKVAQVYGARVSGAAIRDNPNLKAEICRFIGADIRVKDTCAGYIGFDRRR